MTGDFSEKVISEKSGKENNDDMIAKVKKVTFAQVVKGKMSAAQAMN